MDYLQLAEDYSCLRSCTEYYSLRIPIESQASTCKYGHENIIRYGDIDSIKWLYHNKNVSVYNGITFAIIHDRYDVFLFLIDKTDNVKSYLGVATDHYRHDVIEYLIEIKGAKVDQTDLNVAIIGGCKHIVKYYYRLMSKPRVDRFLINYAIEQNMYSIVKFLLKNKHNNYNSSIINTQEMRVICYKYT